MPNGTPGGRGPAAIAADLARRQREQKEQAENENACRRKAHNEARERGAEQGAAIERVEEAGRRIFTTERQNRREDIPASLDFICGHLLPRQRATETDLREWAQTTVSACRLIRPHGAYDTYRSLNRERVVDYITSFTTSKEAPPRERVSRDVVADLLSIAWGLLDDAFQGSEIAEDVAAVWRDAPVAVRFAHNILVGMHSTAATFSGASPTPAWPWTSQFLPPPPPDGVHAPRVGVEGAWEWFGVRLHSLPRSALSPEILSRLRLRIRGRDLLALATALVAEHYGGAVNALKPDGPGGRELAVAVLQRAVQITQTDPSAWDADVRIHELLGALSEDHATAQHARRLIGQGLKDEVLKLGPDYVVEPHKEQAGAPPKKPGRPPSAEPEVIAEVKGLYEKGTINRVAILEILQSKYSEREPFVNLTVGDVNRILDAHRKQKSRAPKKARRTKGR